MSGREFIEGGDPAGLGLPARDWDRLADYVGGALAGTPEEAEVARRVADDPAWHQAYASLRAATAQVSADLDAWGRTPAAMPDEIAERLSAALADAGPAEVPSRATPPPRLGEARARRRLSVVPDDPGATGQPPPARTAQRRRWIQWAKPVAVAAGILGVLGLGLNAVLPLGDGGGVAGINSLNEDSSRDSPTRGDSGAAVAGPQMAGGVPVQRLVASGTDYRRGTVADADRVARNLWSVPTGRPAEPPASTEGQPKGTPPPKAPQAAAPEELTGVMPDLRRLSTTPALSDCLLAVENEHGRTMVRVELVDYASFEGSAALIIVFTDVSGQRTVWASGPDCGAAGAGASALYSARVG
ncbi:MAG TPA: hypothetical protein VFR67_15185 [Pilimelia sp.]|nr:hypothetical protein [Pilimelia sp.]